MIRVRIPPVVRSSTSDGAHGHAGQVLMRMPASGSAYGPLRGLGKVVYTCGNQRIFCSEDCVAIWLNESAHQRGAVLDLRTLWRLAAGWYAGRLEGGYAAASRAPPPTTCAVPGSPARSGASPRGDRRRAPMGVPVIRPGESAANPAATSGPPSPAAPTKPASGAMPSAPNPRHRLNWAAAAWRSCARGW